MSTRSTRRFYTRPANCTLTQATDTFRNGLVAEREGAYVLVSDDEVIARALQILAGRLMRQGVFKEPRLVRDYMTARLAGLEHEVFTCLLLDARNRAIVCEDLFRGTVHASAVHVREVIKFALLHNARGIIVAHNHPSGDLEPSQDDRYITNELRTALSYIDVRLCDHVIVGAGASLSFVERGLL